MLKKLREIGWEPKADFEEELEITTNWYLNNKSWLKSTHKTYNYKRLGLID